MSGVESMETSVLNVKGEEVGKVQLPANVFGRKPSPRFLHEAVTAHLANQRRGTAHTKTRAEVSGGGRKPWKQKHTGRARHGSIRSPLWRKGGVVFGPRAHSFRQDLPRQKSSIALAQALSARAVDGSLRVVEGLALDGSKTRQVAGILKALGAGGKALIVTEVHDENLRRAARNIPELKVKLVTDLNAYDVLWCRSLILTRGAVEKLAPRWN